MAEELEDKYSRFQRNTGIDLQAEIAAGGSGDGLDNYYTKTESDLITDALDVRVTDLEEIPGGGVTDHGALTGLADDDHTQYLNNTRGDVRYYTKSQIDTSLGGKANTSHTHVIGDVSGTVPFAQLPTGTTGSTVATGNHNHTGTYQPIDSDLTAIAGLSPSNNDVVQRKGGVWVNSTPATLKTDLTLTKSDVGLSNVDNTSDANKPISSATQTALNAKAPLVDTPRYLLFDTTWPVRPADSRMTFYIGGNSTTDAPADSIPGDVWIPTPDGV